MIYFKHPRFQFVVKHYIKSQQITTQVRFFGLTCPVKMSKLRLNYIHSFNNNLFNLTPYLTGILSVDLTIPFTDKLSLKNILKSKFMLFAIKFFIVFVQRIVGQVGKCVIKIFIVLIFLACKSDQTIVIQIYCHWTYYLGYQYIYSKVVFVTFIQCWLFYILLDYILILGFFYLSCHYLFLLLLVSGMGVVLQNLNTLFYFQIFVHSISFLLSISIKNLSHFFNFLRNKDTSSLRSRFRLTNK